MVKLLKCKRLYSKETQLWDFIIEKTYLFYKTLYHKTFVPLLTYKKSESLWDFMVPYYWQFTSCCLRHLILKPLGRCLLSRQQFCFGVSRGWTFESLNFIKSLLIRLGLTISCGGAFDCMVVHLIAIKTTHIAWSQGVKFCEILETRSCDCDCDWNGDLVLFFFFWRFSHVSWSNISGSESMSKNYLNFCAPPNVISK